ncbi:MAG TPA: hypothetical protein PKE56_02965, partial [Acidimicrobiales bacterium]|nr:hypothetical protein [Acidimicrobiales bacterium]
GRSDRRGPPGGGAAPGAPAGGAGPPIRDPAGRPVPPPRPRAGPLTRLRAGLDPTLPLLFVPYLFSRSHGARATRQVAEFLAEEL